MKFVRIKYNDKISFGELDSNDVKIIDGDIFGEWNYSGEKAAYDNVKLLAPVQPQQIVAVGLNYYDHVRECNRNIPEEPLIFLKGINAVIGHNEKIVLPRMAPNEVDYEAELAIVIGQEARYVSEDQADNYIFGYICANDISARDCQLRRDSQWTRGKSFDTFCPLGPVIASNIDGDNLDISLKLNDKIMQQSNTSDLIFSCKRLVSFISHCMTLYPGSIIMTGTPAGVGVARNPQVFLREGDVVEVEIEGIGRLTNGVCV